jgi:hypothetical protein
VIAQLGMRGGPNWQPRVTDHYRFALTRPELDDLLIALATPRQVDALAVALEEGPRWTRCKRPTWASRSNGAKIVDPAPGQKPLAPTPRKFPAILFSARLDSVSALRQRRFQGFSEGSSDFARLLQEPQGARVIVRGQPPGRYDVDEIRAEPLPSGNTSRS